MGSLTFSELLTIAIIVLIVFGPTRLPELSRKAGAMLSRVREATRDIRTELTEEYKDAIAPLEEVREDLKAARDDLTAAARAVSEDLNAAAEATREAASSAPDDDDPDEYKPLDTVRDELRAARAAIEASEHAKPAETSPDADDEREGPSGVPGA